MRACTIRERRKKRGDERGMALIMVLLAIVVLTVFLTDVQQDTSSTFSSAISARERLKAEYHARSAINLSRMLIATEPSVRQALGPILAIMVSGGKEPPQVPVWEFADQILGVFNDAQGAEGFASITDVDMSSGENLGLGGNGRFEMVIIDEASKINVNIAAKGDPLSAQNLATQLMGLMHGEQYNPLFERRDADGQDATRMTVCSALIDWADYDENREPCDLSTQKVSAGAEDNVYQALGGNYVRKNAAFDSLEEMRMVQGVSEDFWATFVDPDPRKPGARNLTVWGSEGTVNPNTANAQVLWGLICSPNIGAFDQPVCTDPIKAAGFISTLNLIKGFTGGIPLFGSGKAFVSTIQGKGMIGPMLYQVLGLSPEEPIQLKNPRELRRLLTTRSKVFSVYATGIVPAKNRETRVTIHAVMDFRNAAEIGASALPDPNAPPTPAEPGAPPTPPPPPQDPAKVAMQQMAANPGGNVIYWRMQ